MGIDCGVEKRCKELSYDYVSNVPKNAGVASTPVWVCNVKPYWGELIEWFDLDDGKLQTPLIDPLELNPADFLKFLEDDYNVDTYLEEDEYIEKILACLEYLKTKEECNTISIICLGDRKVQVSKDLCEPVGLLSRLVNQIFEKTYKGLYTVDSLEDYIEENI